MVYTEEENEAISKEHKANQEQSQAGNRTNPSRST